MNLLTRNAVPILAMLVSVAASLAAMPALPPRIPVHWGIDGSIAARAPRSPGAFLIPAAMLCVTAFFYILPYIDKGRTRQLREVRLFEPVRNGAILLFAYGHALSLGIGLGWFSPEANYLVGGASLLVFLLGDAALSFAGGRSGTLLARISASVSSPVRLARGCLVSGLVGMAGTFTGRHQLLWLGAPLALSVIVSRLKSSP